MNTLKEVGQAMTAVVMLTVAVVGTGIGIAAYLFKFVAPYVGPASSRLFIPSF